MLDTRDELPLTAENAAPPVSRIALRVLIVTAAFVGVITTFYCLLITSWTVSDPIDGSITFNVPVATPAEVTNLIDTQFSDDHLTVGYDGDTWIRTDQPVVGARTLTGIATSLPFVIVLTGCIGVIVLARKLGRQRPFTRALRWTLGLLGALTVLSAVCIPWFESLAAQLAATALNLPTVDDVTNHDTESWVVPSAFDVLQDLNWPFFLLGVVLILVSALLVRAAHLQRETEGLV